jgi:hypothetical protein
MQLLGSLERCSTSTISPRRGILIIANQRGHCKGEIHQLDLGRVRPPLDCGRSLSKFTFVNSRSAIYGVLTILAKQAGQQDPLFNLDC